MNSRLAVLFVCLGNICRSPTAHAVFRHMVQDAGLSQTILIDSAGTGDWHVGDAPDDRATEAALRRGYDMRDLRARQVTARDFSHFNYVLAMDAINLRNLRRLCPRTFDGRLDLFLTYASSSGLLEVPDPYYGGADGFERVLDLVEEASSGLLANLRRSL